MARTTSQLFKGTAQAAGAKLTYLALETPSPEAQAIVVTKGAGVHLLITKALEKAGLTLKDVNIAFLPTPF